MIKPMVDHLMVQQQIKSPHKVWKHMVGVMCLNLTYRKHVKIILPKLFKRYPNPQAYLRGRLKTQQEILKPLGMWEVRSKRIRKMTNRRTSKTRNRRKETRRKFRRLQQRRASSYCEINS